MAKSAKKERTFEQALDRLESIVSTLEVGDVSLDEAMKLFEEGTALRQECTDRLESASKRVSELVDAGPKGEPEGDKA